jgi:hypothetical protein
LVSDAGVLGAIGGQLSVRHASVWLAYHATPPAEAEIFGARITDRPPAMVTPLNEPREGEFKAGWPGLGLRLRDNYTRNFALGQEGHVIPPAAAAVNPLPGGSLAKENRVATEDRHPAMPTSSIIIL